MTDGMRGKNKRRKIYGPKFREIMRVFLNQILSETETEGWRVSKAMITIFFRKYQGRKFCHLLKKC
jgi:hypothetical protein